MIDVTGRVNGPALKYLEKEEIANIHNMTEFLNINPKIQLKHRILALYLDIKSHPLCKNNCGKLTSIIPKRLSLFGTFCSDLCASRWAHQDEESINKFKETIDGRLEIMKIAAEKGRNSQQAKYGGYGFQRDDIQIKIKDQNKYCGYIWKDWNGHKVQGYEDQFLNDYFTSELVLDKRDIPKFNNPTYWPDFYNPSTNTLYEIKSVYTLSIGILNSKLIPKIHNACSQGYSLELVLYNKIKEAYQSWTLRLTAYVTIADIESNLKNFLTNIYHENPYVLHRTGRKISHPILEWLGVQMD